MKFLLVVGLLLMVRSAWSDSKPVFAPPPELQEFEQALNQLPYRYIAGTISTGPQGELLGDVVADAIQAKLSGDTTKLQANIQAIETISAFLKGNGSIFFVDLGSLETLLEADGICGILATASTENSSHQISSVTTERGFLIDSSGNATETANFGDLFEITQSGGPQSDELLVALGRNPSQITANVSGNSVSLSYEGLSYSNQGLLPIQGGKASFVDAASGLIVTESAILSCTTKFTFK